MGSFHSLSKKKQQQIQILSVHPPISGSLQVSVSWLSAVLSDSNVKV